MSNAETIGARLYRKVVTPVWSADRRHYTAGCIVHGEGGAVKVIFLQYETGKGIVGRCKPSDEMAGWLKQYGRDLKDYIQAANWREREKAERAKHEVKKIEHTPRRSRKIFVLPPPPGGRF